MKAAILGVTGYTGLLLMRQLLSHPDVTEILPVSSSMAGAPITDLDPSLGSFCRNKSQLAEGLILNITEASALKPDVVFACLPHLKSAELCGEFIGKSVVIDLSADFRMNDPALFQKSYAQPMPRPDLNGQAVYGLTEWNRSLIQKADLIACPGCYPTATLLPLLPLYKVGAIQGMAVVNALSGISGAGKKASVNALFVERSENAGAYLPGTSHRHWGEIFEKLQGVSDSSDLLFTPHLIPLRRGMNVTTVVTLSPDFSGNPGDLLKAAYGNEPWVELLEERLPETGRVLGSNRCDIGWRQEGDRLMLFSVIDNLVKGASGQALQNMNVRFGFDETAGLQKWGSL